MEVGEWRFGWKENVVLIISEFKSIEDDVFSHSFLLLYHGIYSPSLSSFLFFFSLSSLRSYYCAFTYSQTVGTVYVIV